MCENIVLVTNIIQGASLSIFNHVLGVRIHSCMLSIQCELISKPPSQFSLIVGVVKGVSLHDPTHFAMVATLAVTFIDLAILVLIHHFPKVILFAPLYNQNRKIGLNAPVLILFFSIGGGETKKTAFTLSLNGFFLR